jgi:hypothetical protein
MNSWSGTIKNYRIIEVKVINEKDGKENISLIECWDNILEQEQF